MAKLAITIGFAILGAVTGGLGWLGFAGGAASALTGFSIGAAIGGIIGGIAFPGKLPTSEGPRLDNMRVQTSTYGVNIVIGYGTIRTAGNVIDSSGLVEHKTTTKQSAKGAPSQTTITYTYTNTFAVAFTEGEGDIQRMWADGKIIFDATGASEVTAFNTKDPKGHVVKKGLTCRVYRGDETQLPDSSLESLHGVGNVPAYRGLIYVVFEDFLLTNFGNRIPNITANITYEQLVVVTTASCDVTASGGATANVIGYARNRGEMLGISDAASINRLCRMNPDTGALIAHVTDPATDIETGASGQASIACDDDGYIYGSSAAAGGDVAKYHRDTMVRMLTAGVYSAGNASRYMFHWTFSDQRQYIFSFVNTPGQVASFIIDNRYPGVYSKDLSFDGKSPLFPAGDGSITYHRNGGIIDNDENLWCFGVRAAVGSGNYNDAYISEVILRNGHSNITGFYHDTAWYLWDGSVYGQPVAMWYSSGDDSLVFLTAVSKLVKWDKTTQTVVASLDISAYVGATFDDGVGSIVQHLGVDSAGIIYLPGSDNHTWRGFDIGALAHSTDYDIQTYFAGGIQFNNAWAYEPLRRVLVSNRPVSHGGTQWFDFLRVYPSSQGADLADIVTDICGRCALSPAQFDITQLVGKDVPGYLINNGSSGRAAIESLASLYLFGGVESDFKIKFVQGGNSGVFTIPEDDLMEIENGIRLIEMRTQELDLPLEVAVTYLDLNFDYQPGTQREQRFNTTFSVDKSTLSVPIALDAATAKQLAAKVLYLMWVQRNKYQFHAMPKWMLQDALDVGTFGYKGETFYIKLTNATLGLAYQMAFECVVDDANAYASVLPTDGGQATTHGAGVSIISSIPYTEFQVIDTPLLRDEDENDTVSGFYFTTTPRGQGTWPGAVAEQSVDDIAFNPLTSAVVQPTWGYLAGVLAAPSSPWSPDTVSTITVTVLNGTFAGVSQANLLAGSNTAVCGAAGRWEVIQFRDVLNNGNGTWTLSYLLRGRRGTEVNCGNHAIGDFLFVLATDGSTERIDMATSSIGALRYYRTPSIGFTIDDAAPSVQFSNAGNDLMPYAPVQIAGFRDPSAFDWTIGWYRRTRYNGEWKDSTGDVALNETSQSYVIEILDAPGGNVKRTLTAGINRCTYAAADQITDFGSHPTTLNLNIYQVSAAVSRGFKASKTITSVALAALPQLDLVGQPPGGFVINGN